MVAMVEVSHDAPRRKRGQMLEAALLLLMGFGLPVGRAADGGATTQPAPTLAATLDRCARELSRYRRHGDVLNNLYWRLYDQPYLRSTLAILLRTEHALRLHRAALAVGRPSPFLPADHTDRARADILRWCNAALDHVANWDEPDLWRPDRIRVARDTVRYAGGRIHIADRATTLIGFVDAAGPLAFDERLGDLDLIASLGLRWYAADNLSPARRDAVLARCRDLGIGFVDRAAWPPPAGDKRASADPVAWWRSRYAEPEPAVVAVLTDVSAAADRRTAFEILLRHTEPLVESGSVPPLFLEVTVSDLLAEDGFARTTFTGRPSNVSFVAVGRMSGSLADARTRRRVAASVRRAERHTTIVRPWLLASPTGRPQRDARALRAHLFVDLLTGAPGGFVTGWAPPTEMPDSLLARPWLLEVVAHTALDALLLSEVLSRFPGRAEVAVLVSPTDLDPADAANLAPPIRDLCRTLMQAQVLFELIPAHAATPERLAGLRVVAVPSKDTLTASLGDRLARFAEEGTLLVGPPPAIAEEIARQRRAGTLLAGQVVATDADGNAYADVVTATAQAPGGPLTFGLVSLAVEPRAMHLRYRGKPLTGTFQNLVTRATHRFHGNPIVLQPYEVWLCRAGPAATPSQAAP